MSRKAAYQKARRARLKAAAGGGSAAATETAAATTAVSSSTAMKTSKYHATISKDDTQAVREFKEAFNELEHGRVFVNVPELRQRLNWSHDAFDSMMRKMRDSEEFVLDVDDVSPRFNIKNYFYDEHDNSRIGMIHWNTDLERS